MRLHFTTPKRVAANIVLLLVLLLGLCGLPLTPIFAANAPIDSNCLVIVLKNGKILQSPGLDYEIKENFLAYDPCDGRKFKAKAKPNAKESYEYWMPLTSVQQIRYASGLVVYQDTAFKAKKQGRLRYTRNFWGYHYYYNDKEIDRDHFGTHLQATAPKAAKKWQAGVTLQWVAWGGLLTGLIGGLVYRPLFLLVILMLIPHFIGVGFCKKAVKMYDAEQGY